MRSAIAIASILALACGPTVPVGGGDAEGHDESDADTSGGSQPDPSAPTSLTTGNDVSTAGSADDGDPVTTGADDGADFIMSPDVPPTIACDLWKDDCPPGEKCMPYAKNGGGWDATKCSPLAEDPKAPGEPCTVVDSGVSGIDDCEARAMCWNVDPETLMGTCVAFCTGSEANPICENACESCTITGDGVPINCLPECDPLAQDCGEGQGCYPTSETFSCVPDAGGADGALGDECEFLNVCDPGLVCGAPEWVPGCRGAGCCTLLCNVLEENACALAFDGAECIPWYEDGGEPGCSVGEVGVCMLPDGG